VPASAKRKADKDALVREVLAQFRVTFRAVYRHYERVQKTSGITGAQLWLLAEVAQVSGVTVNDLAQRLSLHQSTTSNLVKAVELARLVRRRHGQEDKRTVRVYLTAKGTGVLRKAPKPLRGVLQQGLCDLPAASLGRLHREMSHLLRFMKVSEARGGSTPLSDSTPASRSAKGARAASKR
jgi:DNA-binding MarR family transcriptional regulator